MSKTKIKVPANRAARKNRELEKSRRIVEKPIMRRIGFDLPDKLIKDFKVAVNMNHATMTEMIEGWMQAYCEEVKREKGLDRLSK